MYKRSKITFINTGFIWKDKLNKMNYNKTSTIFEKLLDIDAYFDQTDHRGSVKRHEWKFAMHANFALNLLWKSHSCSRGIFRDVISFHVLDRFQAVCSEKKEKKEKRVGVSRCAGREFYRRRISDFRAAAREWAGRYPASRSRIV